MRSTYDRKSQAWVFGIAVCAALLYASAISFAGVGQVAPSFGEFDTGSLLPSYGVGVRYTVSEEQGINLGIDWARGKDSNAWYFRIAEVF